MNKLVTKIKEERNESFNRSWEYNWKYLFSQQLPGIENLIQSTKKFAFETKLENLPQLDVAGRIDVLLNNKELLIFNLEKQLAQYCNWWKKNYNCNDAHLQRETDEDGYEARYGPNFQKRFCVPFLQPQFRRGSKNSIKVVITKLLVETGLYSDVAQIIYHYCEDDDEEVHQKCCQCGRAKTTFFLEKTFPFYHTESICGRRKIFVCDSECAWNFMMQKVEYQFSNGQFYFLIPCVRLSSYTLFKWGRYMDPKFLPQTSTPFVETKKCAVIDCYTNYNYEWFAAQHVYSLTHQPDCLVKSVSKEHYGCWTYLPKKFICS